MDLRQLLTFRTVVDKGSFSQAAEENALSRILVGFHFRHAVESGVEHGRRIGNRAVNLFLRSVH